MLTTKTKHTQALIALLLMVACTPMFAAQSPRPGRVDSRVQTVNYHPGQVYHIQARFGQETMITFHASEEIMHVGVGDPLAWQALPVARYLMLKPLLEDADTNMNVITQHRDTQAVKAYAFQLDALEPGTAGNTRGTWQLTFHYPEDEQRARAQTLAPAEQQAGTTVTRAHRPGDWNMAYAYSGSAALVPKQVMDDGTFTYFRFDKTHNLPAIFVINADASESLVNWHIDGDYVVVQRTARQFLLRLDALSTRIYNAAESAHG